MLTREEFEEWLSRIWTFSGVTPSVMEELLKHDATLRALNAELVEALKIDRILPRWTTDPPTVPGFYWWKGTGVHSEPTIVEVRANWLVGCYKKPLSEWIIELGGQWSMCPLEPPQASP